MYPYILMYPYIFQSVGMQIIEWTCTVKRDLIVIFLFAKEISFCFFIFFL